MALEMSSEEIKQHVVSIQSKNLEQSNKTPRNQAKRATTSNSVYGCLKIFERHSSTEWKSFLSPSFFNWQFPSVFERDCFFQREAILLLSFFKRRSSIERKAILLLSLVAVFLDPLFFYVPVVKYASKSCIGLDSKLRIIVVVFRSFVDVLHTILWWHHSMSLVHGYHLILSRTLAILAILPLPQVLIFDFSVKLVKVGWLKFIVAIQFVLRLYRILPAYKDATRSSDTLLIYSWFAAAFNLIMYIIASNVLGAFWYILAVERKRGASKNQGRCGGPSLHYDDTSSYNKYLHMNSLIPQASSATSSYNEYLQKNCSTPPALTSMPQVSNATPIDYGIYVEAFETSVFRAHTSFLDKFFQGFWWGLRSLSSLGQNLKTSNHTWDSVFAISIAIIGLVLFALFIGNMQIYLQSKMPANLERIKWRKNYLGGWSPFYSLPEDLRKKVTWCEDPKWQETTQVNLENLLNNMPTELRKELKPYLCKDIFSEIPEFINLRDQPRDKLCALAKPVVFPARSYIFKEGDPIYEVVFVVHGNLVSYDNHSTRTGARGIAGRQTGVRAKRLSAKCILGEELLQQLKQVAQQQQQEDLDESSLEVPIASKTIQAKTTVEAFALSANDLNEVFATYSGRLYQSDNMDNWAASTIQEAWRKHAQQGEYE